MAVPVHSPTKSARQMVEGIGRDLALSDQELAIILAVPIAVLRSERVAATLEQQPTRGRLEQLVELRERLHQTFAPEGGRPLTARRQPLPRGETLIAALMSGRFERVNAALGALDWGIFV